MKIFKILLCNKIVFYNLFFQHVLPSLHLQHLTTFENYAFEDIIRTSPKIPYLFQLSIIEFNKASLQFKSRSKLWWNSRQINEKSIRNTPNALGV